MGRNALLSTCCFVTRTSHVALRRAASQNGDLQVDRFPFRVPVAFTDMPGVARARPDLMGLRQLLRHMREAGLQWRIEYRPFWVEAFARLSEFQEDLGPVEAVLLLELFAQLRWVDMSIVDRCERIVAGADSDELLLDLRPEDLAKAVEALAKMQRPEASANVLRLLVTRAHRLQPEMLVRLIRTAKELRREEATEICDAAARALVELGKVRPAILVDFGKAVAALAAAGRCPAGPGTGVERFFQHVSRRLRQKPSEFTRYVASLANAAEATGYSTPAFRRLCASTESKVGDQFPSEG